MKTWKQRFDELSQEHEQLIQDVWDRGDISRVKMLKENFESMARFVNEYSGAGCPEHDSKYD